MTRSTHIGTLTEQSLHAEIKQWLAKPGDLMEQAVDGYQIDILRGDLLIEIQTRNFSALKRKLGKLLETHKVVLVHPIAQTKWIIRKTKRGRVLSKRKSPKTGRLEHLFDELIYMPQLATHPNLSMLVLLTHEEEIWRDDGKGSWTRKHWSIFDRRLVDVVGSIQLDNRQDFLDLIPASLPYPFSHKQLAKAIKAPIWMSTRMSYCLRKMGYLESVGKEGRSLLLAPMNAADTIAAA
jgi:hypothetical protein